MRRYEEGHAELPGIGRKHVWKITEGEDTLYVDASSVPTELDDDERTAWFDEQFLLAKKAEAEGTTVSVEDYDGLTKPLN
jgi:hypothetical protein